MKIALIGYGKMGKEIEQVIIHQHPQDEIVLKIEAANQSELTVENLKKADVAIDFTQPDAVIRHVKMCLDAGVAVVIGTTAWYDSFDEIKSYCEQKQGAIFHATNFSLGVNIFFEINKRLAQLMHNQHQYAISMTEIHHTEKLDAPSGTAISLAKDIVKNSEKYKEWKLAEMAQEEHLSIRALRQENVPGTHMVQYSSAIDEIEIKHVAHSRRGFAEGAVAAAHWLYGKKGVFEMKDLLAL